MTKSRSPETSSEAVACFETAGDLQAAIDELLTSGFDRSEVCLLATEKAVETKLGHRFGKVRDLEDEPGIPRAAYVDTESSAGVEGGLIGGLAYVGAISAMGAVVASGGTLAAALSGGAGGVIGGVLAKLVAHHHAERIQEQLDHGGLLLWVRTRDAAHERKATNILSRHSAQDVHLHQLLTPREKRNPAVPHRRRAGPVADGASGAGSGGSRTETGKGTASRNPVDASVELAKALRDPSSVFASPGEVLEHPSFTREQMIEVLRMWEYDAVEESVAEEEGMPNGNQDLLQQILPALEQLTGGLDQEHTPPTKHGGLDRASVRGRG